MQPGMQAKPESREMLVDYMHLCDARDRASTLEVLCVLGNTITSAYNAYKVCIGGILSGQVGCFLFVLGGVCLQP